MTAATLRAGATLIAPLHIAAEYTLSVLPGRDEAEEAAVANALYGTSSDDEECTDNADRQPGSRDGSTLSRAFLAAATPRVAQGEPFAAAFSEDSSLLDAAAAKVLAAATAVEQSAQPSHHRVRLQPCMQPALPR